MTIHSKYVDPSARGPYQIFTNDTSVSDAIAIATGDYIDFTTSIGRPAKNVIIILNGVMDITIQFNTRTTRKKSMESVADETIDITEGTVGGRTMRLFSAAGQSSSFSLPAEFPVDIIKIVNLTGAASAANNITIAGF